MLLLLLAVIYGSELDLDPFVSDIWAQSNETNRKCWKIAWFASEKSVWISSLCVLSFCHMQRVASPFHSCNSYRLFLKRRTLRSLPVKNSSNSNFSPKNSNKWIGLCDKLFMIWRCDHRAAPLLPWAQYKYHIYQEKKNAEKTTSSIIRWVYF